MTVVADSLLIYNIHVSVELSVTWTSDYVELLSDDFVNSSLGDVFMSQVNTTQVVRWTHCLTFVYASRYVPYFKSYWLQKKHC